MKELAVYIHIPFCQSKCFYCDFCSYPNEMELVEKYIEYLKKEIDIYSHMVKEYSVKTIFIGGGTPSYIDGRYIFDVLNHIFKRFNTKELLEITIEANPKTVDNEKLNIYRKAGINRISLGVQSFNDDILKEIGRIHTKSDFIETYKLVRKHQYNNVNVDLMFNLPNQTISDVIDTLNQAIKLDVEHISYYSLKVEEGTPFYITEKKGELQLPDEDSERLMYHKGISLLEQNGYKHYEISNFAKKNYQCKHNLFYWNVKPYIGLGLAAHSNINSERYGNVNIFNDYFSAIESRKLPVFEKEIINQSTEIAEYMILGLRLIDGIDKGEFYKRFKTNLDDIYGSKILKLESQGLLTKNSKNIKLTQKGIDLSNIVFTEFLL